MSPRRRFTAPVAVLAGLGLVGAAFLLRLTQPGDEEQQEPFVTTAVFGQEVEGRDLTFLAEDAYLTDRLTAPGWTGTTDGVWLVIDATIGSKLGVTTPYATLSVGGLRYFTSDRAEDYALGMSLDAGLPQQGSFVFELPTSIVESADARLVSVRFATAYRVRLDSAIDMTLDLTSLRHETSSTLQAPGVVVP